ncbi:hypothetical protein [Paenibacillus silvae]|nr:hypothetical protein [Paenibacillus silvae]
MLSALFAFVGSERLWRGVLAREWAGAWVSEESILGCGSAS